MRPALIISTLFLLSAAADAMAQSAPTEAFALDPLQPASAHSPFFVAEASRHPELAPLAVSLLADFAHQPLTVHQDGPDGEKEVGTLVRASLLAHLGISAALTNNLSADLALPVALFQQGDDLAVDAGLLEAPSGMAFGDARLGLLFRGSAAVVGARLWAPTGSQDNYMTDERLRAELVLGTHYASGDWRMACTTFLSPTFVAGKAGDRVALGCAADRRAISTSLRLGAEATASAHAALEQHAAVDSHLTLWAVLGYDSGAVAASVAAGPEFGDAPGTAPFRALARLSFAFGAGDSAAALDDADSDDDGIADSQDACPHEAGPRSDDAARTGCPDKDTDGDGVADHDDACVTEPGAKSADPLASGCPDRDSDLVADKLDACPDQPGTDGGCPKYAVLRDGRFVIQPPVDAAGGESLTAAEEAAMSEIAFTMRANRRILTVAVEVTRQGDDEDVALAEAAAERASFLVGRLVELGVARNRLEPLGAVSSTSSVRISVTSWDEARP